MLTCINQNFYDCQTNELERNILHTIVKHLKASTNVKLSTVIEKWDDKAVVDYKMDL